MKIRKLAVVATALFLPFAAASCGADSTGELDKGELSKEMQKGGLTKAQADCAADALIKSDFTKEEIDALNENAQTKEVDAKKMSEFSDALVGCMTPGG